MYKITKEFNFEMAHILEGHNGPCLNLHGHSYKLLVTVSSNECRNGMVIDFADLKDIVNNSIICKIDHSFCYNAQSKDKAEREIAMTLRKYSRRIYELESRPTAENMSKHFYDILKPLLESREYRLEKVTLYETETSFSEYSEKE